MNNRIETALRREIARILKVGADSFPLSTSLGELGVDSMGYVEIASALSREFTVSLHPETLFEHAALVDTVAAVMALMGEQETPAPTQQADTAPQQSQQQPQQPSTRFGPKDIAIIGTALRVPGAHDLSSLWKMVLDGEPQWSPFPADRLPAAEQSAPLPNFAHGGFVADATDFDAVFFGISAREALAMDPQQRMLLECAWHAFEDAGLSLERLSNSDASVYVGCSSFDYYETLLKTQAARTTHIGTGISHAILANRVSQHFNLTGASEAVDSACASSMVALWRGVESLRRGESELALVAGVNLLGSLTTFGFLADAGMLSPQGQCNPFDDAAGGYVRGEGVVCAVLKPAQAALDDGDRILAVIKGGAVRHSGRTQSLTAPNPQAQADVIEAALKDAAVDAASIGYLEAHGTGTKLGDPVEVQGLKKAFAMARSSGQALPAPHFFIGSIKSQIGHLEAAAGLASVMKAVAALNHAAIPGSPQMRQLNRFIDLGDAAFRMPTLPQPWQGVQGDVHLPDGPRRAGVSCFGFGGSNSHVVLEEAPAKPARDPGRARPGARLFVVSAKSGAALGRMCVDLAGHIDCLHFTDEHAEWLGLDDIAYTLRCRSALAFRLAVVATSRSELVASLRAYGQRSERAPGVFAHGPRRDAATETDASGEQADLLASLRALSEHGLMGDVNEIGRLWAQGLQVPWGDWVPRGKAERIALPGYPFMRERFWPVDAATGPAANPAATPVASEAVGQPSLAAAACYEARWDASPLLNTHRAPSTGTLAAWVAGPRGQQVAELCSTLVGRPMQTFDCSVPAVVARLSAAPCPAETSAFIDLTPLDDAGYHTLGVPAKLALLRQWLGSALKRGEPIKLLHATCGLQMPTADSAPATAPASERSLAGAQDAAFYEHLGAEYKRCHGKTLDFGAFEPAAMAQCLIDELENHDGHHALAYRQGNRFARRMQPLQAVLRAPQAGTLPGVALVTGGTGDIGLQLASDLAARGFRALLLTGRSALSESKEAWARQMREQGVALSFYRGELTDEAALKSALGDFSASHGAITHVFHCAGTVDSTTPGFLQKTQASIARVMAPKVDALQVLHKLFVQRPPQAFVLFSSVSAVAPSLAAGVLDYAAANNFLDLFAQHQHAQGRPYYLSVQWTRWQGLGMARSSRQGQDHGQALDATTCLDTLHRLLAQEAGHLPASLCVLAEGDTVFNAAPEASDTPKVAPAKPKAAAASANAANSAASALADSATSASVREQVRRLLALELEVPESRLDDNATFEEMGVDSIILMGLITQIEKWLGQVVEPQELIDCDSITSIARYIERRGGPALAAQPEAAQAAVAAVSPPPANTSQAQQAAATTPAPGGAPRAPAMGEPFKVAVIGMACRFPGASGLGAFWNNLKSGVDSVVPVPPERWDRLALYADRMETGRSISQWGGFIDDIESITPRMFGMNEKDAADVDPLVRLFTECSMAAAADSPLGQDGLKGRRVGVFAGARAGQYSDRIPQPGKQSITGIGQNFVAAFVSHLMDLRGPNLVIDSACSSSLAAIHLACQSLRCGESELALAGGVEVLLDEQPYLFLSASGALSPEGKCRAFDANANGFVPGEGVGCVLLKPLHLALADGDPVYAVIAGSAMNNDGHTLGITTPGVAGQVDVIEHALRQADVPASNISYVEAHGTGTLIGDPIELQALSRAYQSDPPARCGVGSVKSNLGHLLSAAGVASFIKVALSLHHRTLPPTLHVEQVNPRFNFESTPFFPVREAQGWEGDGSLHAGISAFGFGKTNVHMVLAEAPSTAPRPQADKPHPQPAGKRVKAWHAAKVTNRPVPLHAVAPRLGEQRLLEMTDLVVEEEDRLLAMTDLIVEESEA